MVRRLIGGCVVALVVCTGVATASPVTPTAWALVMSAPEPAAPYTLVRGSRILPDADRWVLPLESYRLTGTFGARSRLWRRVHTGLDFATGYGTAIHSVAAGTVTSAGYDGAYGYKTVVTHDDGTEVWYCHQSAVDVAVGDQVGPGQVIGYVGTTGNTTGPHLHLEVRVSGDVPVDPIDVFRRHGLHP